MDLHILGTFNPKQFMYINTLSHTKLYYLKERATLPEGQRTVVSPNVIHESLGK